METQVANYPAHVLNLYTEAHSAKSFKRVDKELAKHCEKATTRINSKAQNALQS